MFAMPAVPRWLKAFLLCLFGGIAAILLVVVLLFRWYHAPQPYHGTHHLDISRGSSFQSVAARLQDAALIDDKHRLLAISYITGDYRHIKAGEYAFAPGLSPQQMMQQMVEGRVVVHALTIPEGWQSRQILQALKDQSKLSGDVPEALDEGTVLPDTYHFQRGESRKALLARMQVPLLSLIDSVWQQRQQALPLQSKAQLVVLASIVEKETGIAAERAKVAGVFVNRLRAGMPLQSDPTTIYAIERDKGVLNRPLRRADWKYQSPYNTYAQAGLPPAPICHPGKEALQATANPQPTDALYFVATGDGGHAFARTLSEHNQNVARYLRRKQAVAP